jgi:hypothetical protein
MSGITQPVSPFIAPISGSVDQRLAQIASHMATREQLALLEQRVAKLEAGPVTDIGAWQAFVADPGWFSILRYRLTPFGVQLEGALQPQGGGIDPGTGIVRFGVLPLGYRPGRQQWMTGPVATFTPAESYAFGVVKAEPNGDLSTWWSVGIGGGAYLTLSGVLTVDA